MKSLILFTENYTAGGADQVARTLLEHLPVHSIHLVFNSNLDPKILLKPPLSDRVKLHPYRLLTTADFVLWAQSLHRLNPFRYLLRMVGWLARYPLFLAAYFIFRLQFRQFGSDVFLANNGGYPGGEYCRIAAIAAVHSKISKVAMIFHSIPTAPRKILRWLEFRLDQIIDRDVSMITVSNFTARALLEKRAFKRPPICIYNGLEQELSSGKKRSESSILRVLHIGYFDANKNQILLLKALKQVLDWGVSGLELVFVGDVKDCEYFKRFKQFSAEHGLDPYIKLEGYQDDVGPYFKSCDVFGLCSQVEGFPLVILEAMRAALPVISTRVGGVGEMIEHGLNGWLVEPEDFQSIALYLRRLSENRGLLEAMGFASRKAFDSKFTRKTMMRSYVSALGL